MTNFDPDSIKGWRRDYLEIFGNTWGNRKPEVEPMTAEERQALEAALNPFANRGK